MPRSTTASMPQGPTDDEIHQRALARWSADVARAEHDLGLFIEMYNEGYSRPDHLGDLLEALDRSMREPVYALVEAPPRHAKTETILNAMARRMKYRPRDSCAYCSYAAPLALRKSRRTRDIAARAGLWVGDETVRRNKFDPSASVSYWQTIDGGSFTAGGRGGAFIGEGYSMVVYDDPYKNREEAESPVIQEKADETWRSTLANRVEPGGSAIITHQGWNSEDIIERLRDEVGPAGQRWEVISLPAVIDAVYDDDGLLIGGTPLWPSRWSLRDLARRAFDVQEYNWHSQYQQDRRPRGDAVFGGEPARFTEPMIDQAFTFISCDPGIEDNKIKDSSGIVVASCYRRQGPYHTPSRPQLLLHMDILHAEDRWLDWVDLLNHLEELQTQRFRGAAILLEEVSAFRALSGIAARLNPSLRLYPITPRGSKILRAQPTGKMWSRGGVRLPLGGRFDGPWVAHFLKEAHRFTGRPGGKDNMIDAMTQLADYAEHALSAATGGEVGGEIEMASSPF